MCSARFLPVFLSLCVVLFGPIDVGAQPPSPQAAPSPLASSTREIAPLLDVGTTEWMATVGTAFGVVVFHSAEGHKYLMQTLSWGRVLTRPRFPGVLRGRFEWALEVMPVYGQYQPDRVFGVGVSPLSWRWNFEPRGRYAPFVQLSGGVMKSSGEVPPGTTSANFTAHAGGGVRVLVARQQSVVLSYRFDHISNGNRLDRNPGVNAHAIHVGWSLLKPRP